MTYYVCRSQQIHHVDRCITEVNKQKVSSVKNFDAKAKVEEDSVCRCVTKDKEKGKRVLSELMEMQMYSSLSSLVPADNNYQAGSD